MPFWNLFIFPEEGPPNVFSWFSPAPPQIIIGHPLTVKHVKVAPAKIDFVSQANRQFQFYCKWKPLLDTDFDCSQDNLYTVTLTFLLLHSKTYMYYFFGCFGLIYLSFSPFPPFFRKCWKLQISGEFVEKCIKTQNMSEMNHIILHRIPVRTEHDKEVKVLVNR